MSDRDREQESRDVAENRPPGSSLTPNRSPRERNSSPTLPASPAPNLSKRGDGSKPRTKAHTRSSIPREQGIGTDGERWQKAIPAMEDRLRKFGYDIEPTQPGVMPSSTLVARRDLEDRVVVIAIDGGGRFRAAITWVVGEWPSRDEIAGVPVRVVDAVSRAITVTGQFDHPEQVAEVVASLKSIVPWASVAEAEPPPAAT